MNTSIPRGYYLCDDVIRNSDHSNLYNISSNSLYGLQIIPPTPTSLQQIDLNYTDDLLIENFAIILNHLKYQDDPNIYVTLNPLLNDIESKPSSPLRSDDLDAEKAFDFADDEMEEELPQENPQDMKDWKEKKKAPNGSACEKHKRWKKRCPSNCPHRKNKKKKGNATTEKSTAKISPYVTHGEIQNIIQEEEKIHDISWAPWNINTPTKSAINQTHINQFEVVIDTFERPQRDSVKRRRMSEDELLETEDAIPPLKRKSPTRKYNSHACSYHKMLHARCPLRCPQRISLAKEEKQKSITTFNLYL